MARGRRTSLTSCLTPADRLTLLIWQRSTTISAGLARRVAYLVAADNVSGPLASRLSSINQPVLRTRNAFSTLLPSLLADI
jgi:hypothetical protein